MGASTFFDRVKGRTAKEAFQKAVEEALYYYGHEGYTGTIAEKSSFVMISVPAGKKPEDYANELINNSDRRVDDKWGPAGCIKIAEEDYLFFGWASC